MRFEMLSEGQEMPKGTRSFHKSGRARRGTPKKPGTRPPRGRR
jgi:ribonuclease R